MSEDRQDVMVEILVRSHRDWDFRNRLLKDPATVMAEYGVELPEGTELKIVADNDSELTLVLQEFNDGHFFRVVTDDALLGRMAKDPVEATVWRATFDAAFRRRFTADPKAALEECGIRVRDGVKVQVAENTVNIAHMKLPEFAGAEGQPAREH